MCVNCTELFYSPCAGQGGTCARRSCRARGSPAGPAPPENTTRNIGLSIQWDCTYTEVAPHVVTVLLVLPRPGRPAPRPAPRPHRPVLVPRPALRGHRPVEGGVEVGGRVRPGVPSRNSLGHKVRLLPARLSVDFPQLLTRQVGSV